MTDYNGLRVKVSFGKGNVAKVPWIAFLGKNQKTSDGIYPVYLLYKKYQMLLLAYGVSETLPPVQSWNLTKGVKTVKEYLFSKNMQAVKYGSSFFFAAYPLSATFDWDKMHKDLESVIAQYKLLLMQTKPTIG